MAPGYPVLPPGFGRAVRGPDDLLVPGDGARVEEPRISELENVLALDLETSGLDEGTSQVLEIACVFGAIRDGSFVECESGARFQRVLPLVTNIEDWHEEVLKMHTANGLLAEAVKLRKELKARSEIRRDDRRHTDGYFFDLDSMLAQRAIGGLPPKAKWTLLGNTVHFDKRFLSRHFPQLHANLSHRIIDCSSLRLFCESMGRPYNKGDVAHRAMPDVEQSLELFAACRNWCRVVLPGLEEARNAGAATP